MINRRHFIKIAGGGVVLSAAAFGGFAATRTPDLALSPWTKAGQYSDPRRAALSYAILAPNPHNRQPWLVDLSGDNEVFIYRDKAKNLPETDPYDRQLTIGMGCFIELLDIAARQFDHRLDIKYFPNGETGAVAHAVFMPIIGTPKKDPLFHAILDRRSCKEPFQSTAPSPTHQRALSEFGDVIVQPESISKLKKITREAFDVEYETPHTLKESIDLMRMGKSEIIASPDGIDMGGTVLELLQLTRLLTRKSLLDPKSSAYQQGQDMYHQMLDATPSYILIKTRGNSRRDQIEAGRKWARLNLTTTKLGLSLQIGRAHV